MMSNASVWGESAAKAMSADYQFPPEIDAYERLMPESSIIGAPASIMGIGGSGSWPIKLIPDSLREVIPSDTRNLFISGSIDFSTPAKFTTEKLLPHMPNSEQVILKEFGHTGDIWNLQPEATVHMLKTFFDSGEVDDSKYAYSPMVFKTGLGFAGMMKLGLAGVILLLLIVVFLGRFIYRRLKG